MFELPLAYGHLRTMIRLMRALHRLHHQPAYHRMLEAELPRVARFDPGHESMMMGYDFHITPEGPQLIEVNTNAGGGLLAYSASYPTPVPGCFDLTNRYQADLLEAFNQEMTLFSAGAVRRPTRVAILDEDPENQYLYKEMKLLCALFDTRGIEAVVVGPEALHMGQDGVFLRQEGAPGSHGPKGGRVDLIYNRHCDFYLETPALAGLREAYLAGRVCLTPNPRSYGLLSDKRRMILWSDPQKLRALGMNDRDRACLQACVPTCTLLAERDPEQVWATRKQWVFKPVTAFGSRGVLLGGSLSRRRFASLDGASTLVQRHIPPSQCVHPTTQTSMKVDFRLFVYRNMILGLTARLYRGQVTNFREPGSGYVPVRMEHTDTVREEA